MGKKQKNILWFKSLSKNDIPLVGGKNASLGEMYNQLTKRGVNVPDGFALTTNAYWYFLEKNNLEKQLKNIFKNFNSKNIKQLQKAGKRARQIILQAKFPADMEKEIGQAYSLLEQEYGKQCEVAVRSSGVAEDAPKDSFAGQFETFLNIKGKNSLIEAIKQCLASSFNDRVIAYREEKNLDHFEFALSIGVQKMVRSDISSSGVIFTLDTESGFPDVVLINSIWGVGEMIVQGQVTPDEFYVHKPTLAKGFKSIILKNLGRKSKKYIFAPQGGLKEVKVKNKHQLAFSLNDKEILTLAKWAVMIEKHYNKPQDIEWAKDGKTNKLFIVQARPETVHTQIAGQARTYEEYKIKAKKPPLLRGIAVGNKIGQGKVRIISHISKIYQFKKGEVLVTKMTDPDWLPAMRIASAIVTDEGGKTAHAAIVAREFGIPAIVGAKTASRILKNNELVTVDCTQGLNGRVFKGKVPFEVKKYNLDKLPELKTKIMLNIGAPEIAFKTAFLPNHGVGLARQEFIIAEKIRVHPLALYHYKKINNIKAPFIKTGKFSRSELNKIKKDIAEITVEHEDKREFFIKELAEGIAQIAAAFYPKEVILRLSDFKTNEYRNLVGGQLFEGKEENPMLGFRGASRYLDKEFEPAFNMECQAIKRCCRDFGLSNISLMIPFCRTPEEGKKVLQLMEKFGLKKGKNNLKVYVMCEIPVNVILAEQFLKIIDGYSIGSNDLTQLVLGIDRDNAKIAHIGDERNQAIKEMISQVIKVCRKNKKYCGICGQAPSDFPEFARFLVDQGIESISLNPDTVIKTILDLASY